MIRNQWYGILESSEVKRGRVIGVTRLGEKLAVWRGKNGQVGCARDQCAHRGAALSQGEVSGEHVRCPFHGFQYDCTGRCQLIPANGKDTPVPEPFRVHTYPLREAYGFIWLWWGEPREEYPSLPFFDDIDATYSFGTFRDSWSVHYSRAIENQLDVMHLPFVHRTTIGRGGRSLVDGPRAEWVGDELVVWVYNRLDDGTPPRRADELPEPNPPGLLHFRFPNIWQNRISDDVRIVACFAPVDAENSRIYFRFYHRITRLPVLRELVSLAGRVGNRVIARQDKRVVITQQPKASSLYMGEKLAQGDRPIVEYRRRRQALLDANNIQPQ